MDTKDGRAGFGIADLFTMAFGTIVGVGWIVMLGQWLTLAGSVGSILAFAGGACVVCLIVLSYAELGAMFPHTGGEMLYAYESIGPHAAFVVGWLLVLVYLGVAAFEAISLGWLMGQLLPGIEGPVIYTLLGEPIRLGSLAIGLSLMAVITMVNYAGVRTTATLQNVLTYVLVGLTLTFVIAGIWQGEPDNLRPYFVERDDGTGIWPGVRAVLFTAPFWYAGFNVVAQALGERSAGSTARSAGRAMIIAVIAAFLFYALVILATSLAAPRPVLLDAELPAAAAFHVALQSGVLSDVVLLAGILGLLTTWNATFYVGSRLLFTLSRAAFLPAAFGTLRHGSPAAAVVFVGILGGMATLAGRGAIAPIANLSGAVFALIYGIVTGIVVFLRLTRPEASRPYRIPGGLAIPVLGCLGAFTLFGVAVIELSRASATGIPPEFVILALWLVAGFCIRAAWGRESTVSRETQRKVLWAADP